MSTDAIDALGHRFLSTSSYDCSKIYLQKDCIRNSFGIRAASMQMNVPSVSHIMDSMCAKLFIPSSLWDKKKEKKIQHKRITLLFMLCKICISTIAIGSSARTNVFFSREGNDSNLFLTGTIYLLCNLEMAARRTLVKMVKL